MIPAAFDVRPEQVQAELFTFSGLPVVSESIGGPGPLARESDPITSHQAADSISTEALEASERFVLDTLRRLGPATDDLVIFQAELDGKPWEPSRIRTARKQLADKGAVRDSGLIGLTRKGRKAKEWEVVS